MCKPKLLEETSPPGQSNGNNMQAELTLQQAELKVKEAETLLLAIDTAFGELKQPLTVLLGLSDLLLTRIDSDDPIAEDLANIVKQVNRMSSTINGVDYLTRYQSIL